MNNDEDAGPDSFNLMMELLSDEENMEPTGNAGKNLNQLNDGAEDNNLISGDDKIRNEKHLTYNDLIIRKKADEADNNLIENNIIGNEAEEADNNLIENNIIGNEENMKPSRYRLENLDQVDDFDGNNLVIENKNEADNQAEIGKQDADLLNQAFIMKKRKKNKKK